MHIEKDKEEFTFLPVTQSNKNQIFNIKLETFQKGFIESSKECIEEADIVAEWKPKGIYLKKVLIGFTMYGKIEGRVWLDRFMIDKQYQGKGYGKKALISLIENLWIEYSDKEIFLSLYEENKVAMNLYISLGFRLNGELDTKGEKIMVLKNYIWKKKKG